MPLGTSRRRRRAAPARRFARTDGPSDLAPRRAARSGAEQSVDDDSFAAVARLIQCDDRALAELLDCERSFGAGIGRSRSDRLDDADARPGRVERARDDPRVAAVVPRAREHQDAGVEPIHVAERDLGGSGGAGALHERARGHTGGDRRGVARRRFRARDDADQSAHGALSGNGGAGRSSSDRERPAPRILALKRLIEVEHVDKFFARIGRLAHEQLELDQREHDVADVGAVSQAPMLENQAGHDAKSFERQVATGQGELAARDVAALFEALLAILEGGRARTDTRARRNRGSRSRMRSMIPSRNANSATCCLVVRGTCQCGVKRPRSRRRQENDDGAPVPQLPGARFAGAVPRRC